MEQYLRFKAPHQLPLLLIRTLPQDVLRVRPEIHIFVLRLWIRRAEHPALELIEPAQLLLEFHLHADLVQVDLVEQSDQLLGQLFFAQVVVLALAILRAAASVVDVLGDGAVLKLLILLLGLTVPWWFDAPSVMGFYALFYSLFDNYIWRWSFLRLIRVVKTPVIGGEWSGSCVSSFNNTTHEVSLSVRQTWTTIQIILTAPSSQSHSLVAAIVMETPGGPSLNYQYQSDPRSGSPEGMHIHYGTTRRSLRQDLLEGEYYSGRDR